LFVQGYITVRLDTFGNPEAIQPMNSSSSNPPGAPLPAGAIYRALPGSIWALGFVSLFMDTSSELVHSLLPVYMASVLGVSVAVIGMIEGIAEATAAIVKVFSGAISDYCRKRKLLVLLGYGLGAITKPVFPLAASIGWVFAARFVDRIGKGIRGAPRDALVADLVPREMRGAAYGLRQSLDSVGAFAGPLLAVVFLAWWANDIKAVLWVAVAPAFITVALIVVGVREPGMAAPVPGSQRRLFLAGARQLSRGYWLIVALGAVFTLARFSEAFLVLRAQGLGLAVGLIPMIMIVMNVVYAAGAYPAGVAADRMPPRTLLVVGLGMLMVADVILAAARAPIMAFIGAGFWGLHMAFTQGLLAKLVADTAPDELRGTAFGVFNLISGGALLLASAIAGSLWSAFGPSATFTAGAGFAALAAVGLLLYRPSR
jgi:MFS family permease